METAVAQVILASPRPQISLRMVRVPEEVHVTWDKLGEILLNPRKKWGGAPKELNAGSGERKTEETERDGVAPKQPENGDSGTETPISRRDHRVALAARAQGVSSAGVGWVGARSAAPHWAEPGDPASATDPGQPALAPRQGRAKLGWAGIDRRSDKIIDFCAEKLIDLLLAPRTREPPAGGAGDTSVQGGRAPWSPAPARGWVPAPSPRGPHAWERGRKRGPGGGTLKEPTKEDLRGESFPHQGPRTYLPPNSP